MTDIDKLIAAVEAGATGEDVLALARAIPRMQYEIGRRDDADDVRRAHVANDMNAALRLHKALLPGWAWTVGDNETTVWPPNDLADEPWCADGVSASADKVPPARSWLLAILRALKEKGQ